MLGEMQNSAAKEKFQQNLQKNYFLQTESNVCTK